MAPPTVRARWTGNDPGVTRLGDTPPRGQEMQPFVTHGYLEGERPLFASYHAPAEGVPARNVAYVLCLPLHLELIQSYGSMRRCAEVLAAAGFHVMRVDYDGTGESAFSTDDDPDRVAAWLESVR